MERKIPFMTDEYYHVYNRGVAKQPIFFKESEKDRLQKSLYLFNTKKSVVFKEVEKEGFKWDRGDTIVDILAYAFMPNHFHLILHEKAEGGISTFVRKLLTSHSSYINKKYNRSGPLLCHPFRAKHIESDEYFNWLLSYVHLNPLELFDRTWKEEGLKNSTAAKRFIQLYKHSSFIDYYINKNRPESKILNKFMLPFNLEDLESIDYFVAECSVGAEVQEDEFEDAAKFLT